MRTTESSPRLAAPDGFVLAPLHLGSEGLPLRLCLLVRQQTDPAAGPFILLRELPGSRVYLGAIADAEARIQEWVEIWVQSVELRDLEFSGQKESLDNAIFDARWQAEYQSLLQQVPERMIVTGMEKANPSPLLIEARPPGSGLRFAPTEPTAWQLCKDDALLASFGLPAYTGSPYRYLHQPTSGAVKTFLAVSPDAPTGPHVQSLDRLKTSPETDVIFNPQAGLVRVSRFTPLGMEDYLQVLEGRPWEGLGPGGTDFLKRGIYADLQAWSGTARGMPFLLHGQSTAADRLNEVFFLKLSMLLSMFETVRGYVKTHQLPMLNLSPASFGVELAPTGNHFPALWPSRSVLAKPGQAHPLKIRSTEQKYFVRLGKVEPSPFLPEGLGAHSFGIGNVRRRNVLTEGDGIVLEGTLVAENYLGLDPNDLLWFQLPLGEERLEFYAHVYTSEAVGPKEARFRTVPAKLPEAAVAVLKNTAAFARAPYEIWPLLSSPCDLHSLGIMAIRFLLANADSNLPLIVDDVLGLARYLGKTDDPPISLAPRLAGVLEKDAKLRDLVSPHCLTNAGLNPAQARAAIFPNVWLDTMAWLMRLFPGAGKQTYCQSFGDVSPLALETVFDGPIQDLESLVLRLRSVLVPTAVANEEIASVILDQLAKA